MKPVTDRPGELTIEQLAQETGMSVRNIRAHQSRGLLPPPELRARTGYYGPAHVTRLRLIQEMQAAGFNLAAIKHLVDDAASGDEVIDFARALMTPFESERPEMIDGAELAERLGGELTPKLHCPRRAPRARHPGRRGPLRGSEPDAAGRGRERRALRDPAADGARRDRAGDPPRGGHEPRVREVVPRRACGSRSTAAGQPETDWPNVREALEGLRPLASDAVVSVFQQRMSKAVEEAFGKELRRSRGRK